MEIIERLILFLLSASVLIQLAPENSYKKCIRFFTGLIFMVLLLSSYINELDNITSLPDEIFNVNKSYAGEDYESIFNEYYGNLIENEDR